MGQSTVVIDLRMTLKSLADTAAAAIVHRMMTRSSPLVFLPVVALRMGVRDDSEVAVAMVATLL